MLLQYTRNRNKAIVSKGRELGVERENTDRRGRPFVLAQVRKATLYCNTEPAKLASYAMRCHSRHPLLSDVSSRGRMQEQPDFCMAPPTSKSWAFWGPGPGLQLHGLHGAWHVWTPKEFCWMELHRVGLLLLARYDAFTSLPQLFICKMGAMIVPPLQDCPKRYVWHVCKAYGT